MCHHEVNDTQFCRLNETQSLWNKCWRGINADAGVADDSAAFHWFTHVSSDSIEIYNTSLL